MGRHVSARLVTWWERLGHLSRRYDQFFVAAAMMLAMALGAGLYFRNMLLNARYEQLLSAVHLRNFVLRLTHNEAGGETSQTPGAWHEIRMARRAMNAGNWSGARGGFAAAMDLARAVGDTRTSAMAALDLARCFSMLGSYPDALAQYQDILRNPDASPSVADLAQLEALSLALLRGDQASAMQVLGLRPLPGEGPVRDSIRCLAGEIPTQSLNDRIELMPQRLRNDAHLALALRLRMDGDDKGCTAELRRALQSSSPAAEWPGPLARSLLGDVRD